MFIIADSHLKIRNGSKSISNDMRFKRATAKVV